MSIIIAHRGRDAQKLEPRAIPREDYLQQYILANPETLPMEEIQEDIRLIVIAKEFATESGPIDAIALDQDGEIYIVETKLYMNPDKRTVLAQALDYGAALWSSEEGADSILARLHEEANSASGRTLLLAIQEEFGLDDSGSAEVLEAVKSNVENGALRFVILMDRLDDRPKNLISFMNENSRFTIYGVELEFYEFEEHEIVIPKLYGAEVRKEVRSASPRRTWNERDFFEDAGARLDSGVVVAIKELYEFARETSDQITWGTGVKSGSFNPRYRGIAPSALFSVYSNGGLVLNYGAFVKSAIGKQKVVDLAKGIEKILGMSPPPGFESNYPNLKPEQWVQHTKQLLESFRHTFTRDYSLLTNLPYTPSPKSLPKE